MDPLQLMQESENVLWKSQTYPDVKNILGAGLVFFRNLIKEVEISGKKLQIMMLISSHQQKWNYLFKLEIVIKVITNMEPR